MGKEVARILAGRDARQATPNALGQRHPNRPLRGCKTRLVRVKQQNDLVTVSTQQIHMGLRQRRAERCHRFREPRLLGRQAVGVTLHHHGPPARYDRIPSLVQPVQLATFVE